MRRSTGQTFGIKDPSLALSAHMHFDAIERKSEEIRAAGEHDDTPGLVLGFLAQVETHGFAWACCHYARNCGPGVD